MLMGFLGQLNQVKERQMALSTIGTNSVADSAVTSAKISDGTIATGDLANDAVTGAKVADLDALTVSGDLTIQGTTTAQGTTVGFVSFDKLLLDGTDGSATDAGDNLILNGTDATSANADSSILFDDATGDPNFVSSGASVNVLQVVHTLYDDEESIAGQANTIKATGLIGTITPTSATSKILITYGISLGTSASGAAMGGQHHTVQHDIGQTGSYTSITSRYYGGRHGGNGTYAMMTSGGQLLHEPQTTSAINYNVYFHYTSNWDKTMYVNRGGTASPTDAIDGQSFITLMEIAG